MTDAADLVAALEGEAAVAIADGDLATVVSVRGRLSRLRRSVEATDPQWDGLQRISMIDDALGAAVTGLQVARRRALPVPLPERISDLA